LQVLVPEGAGSSVNRMLQISAAWFYKRFKMS
jgi:hypothetical protein